MKKFLTGLLMCATYLIQCTADNIRMPEYTNHDVGIKCMAFNVDDAPFFKAISRLDAERKAPYETLLRTTLEKMKTDHTAKGMKDVASDLTRLSNALPLEQQEIFEDIFLNLFVRSALEGNTDAMFGILSVSFNVPGERLSRVFTVEGVDLNFSELKEKLEAELDVSESPEAFKKVIRELKSHSAPTSIRNSDTSVAQKSMQHSHSEPDLLKLKKAGHKDK